MRILITGTPGTGKTRLAEWLAKKLGYKLINEKKFALAHKLGSKEGKEYAIPLKKLQAALKKELKESREVVLEGHLLCEIKLPADLVLVLTVKPELLLKRLSQRKWQAGKIQDNVFCESIGYCRQLAKKNYRKIKELKNEKTFKELKDNIIQELRKAGLKC